MATSMDSEGDRSAVTTLVELIEHHIRFSTAHGREEAVLSVAGIPDRAFAREQSVQPWDYRKLPRVPRGQRHRLAAFVRRGGRRGVGQWWAGAAGGVLPGFIGNAGDAGLRLRDQLRVRALPATDQRRVSGRATR